MGIIIKRPWLEEFLKQGGRRLLYGRRKTGKTFYTRLVLPDYQYFIVRKGGTIYDPLEDQEIDTRVFLRLCRSEDNIVLDEFHRADPRLFDALQAGVCQENMVLITSTMHYHRRFTEGPEAPLKGLFSIRQVGLISPVELLATDWSLEGKILVEHLVFYQEPVLIGRSIKDIVLSGREFAKSLVGEVLDEEDYTYTRRFDAILEAIAAGRNKLTEIAAYLHARGLLEKPSTSHITKYIDVMLRTGLLERIEVWGKRRRSLYRHVSPLTELVYYLDARYGFYDLPLPWSYIEKAVKTRIPLLVERFMERLLAGLFGYKPVKILEPEIDIALAEFQRIRLVAEVKWVEKLTRRELRHIEEKLARFPDAQALLIVPDKTIVPETWLEVWDTKDLAAKARQQTNT
ncbi:hypothetical protein Pyrde_0414 [Pyrodictium delaneyi]|uniref:ATPase n=1 Tax=Pyrodictium delaneyi TaxID=1273541 RepID=A0A0P0N1N8_9CREN|nr:hypothetical protein [Pyrodictium delaneyi]ALL00464.1 hypothetical protein Pyrde_0414 [Pyrodictium delaneyi]OWJ53937.1 hypothetical protein Pdsh_08605 [Pyrodictium delaneyi]